MTVEEAIAEARRKALAMVSGAIESIDPPLTGAAHFAFENETTEHDAALRRIALAAYESMPHYEITDGVGDSIWCGEDHGDGPAYCDRCQKVQEYSA